MDKLLLIDVSGYLFRAYFALPAMTSDTGEATHAVYGFARSLLKILRDFEPTHIAAVFDGPHGKRSRTELFAEYKIHRKPIPPDLPKQIERAGELCGYLGIPTLMVEGVEADDVLGTLAHHFKKRAKIYLCTSDKDLYQLVDDRVFIVNTFKDNAIIDRKGVEEKFGVPPEQIVDLLAMMGDTSDNIPGLPGFGPKTAAKLLQEFGSLDAILKHPEKVPGEKKQETLKADREIALLSRKLAQIDLDVDCPRDTPFYERMKVDEEALRAFYHEMKFTSLLKELSAEKPKAVEEIKTTYTLVDDERGLKALIAKLSQEESVAFDTETTDFRPIRARLVGIGFGVKPGYAWYVPTNGKLGYEAVVEAIKPLFANKKIAFYGHNVKYDLHVLANCGIEVANVGFDTIIASYVLNSHQRSHSLDALSLQYFDKVKIPIKELIGTGQKQIGMDEVPIERVNDYCCEDVDYTVRLKGVFEKALKGKLADVFYQIELPLVEVLFKMERAGIFVDVEKLKGMRVMLTKELAKLEREIYHLAGEEFKINSPKQLSEILFTKLGIKPLKKTQTGHSTAADVLEQLSAEHPIAKKILEYRVLEKLRSTYVESLPGEVNPETGRIHCTFNQSVAATGRLSCQDPNLQNIPIRSEVGKKVREAFRPEKGGWQFLSADYSQIELRLLAHLSEDPALVEAFKKGEDVHAYTASQIFGVPIKEVTGEMRHQAKGVNFGIVYGQQAFGLAQGLGIPMKRAAKFIEAYFDRFAHVRAYIDACKERAKEEGKAVTMIGRERLLPDIMSRNVQQQHGAERLAINTPLQGSAADLIKMAMLQVDTFLEEKKLKSKMLLQIHDELIFEVAPGELEVLRQGVKDIMEGVMKLKVPLVVDLSVGNNWKEC